MDPSRPLLDLMLGIDRFVKDVEQPCLSAAVRDRQTDVRRQTRIVA